VGERRLEVVGLEEGGDHDQVLGHPIGVLLGQGAQLAVDGSVELLAGDPLRDARLGKARPLGGQSRPTPVLAVVLLTGCRTRASARRSSVTLPGGTAATVPGSTGAALAARTAASITPRGAPTAAAGAAGRATRACATIAALLGHAINSSVCAAAAVNPPGRPPSLSVRMGTLPVAGGAVGAIDSDHE